MLYLDLNTDNFILNTWLTYIFICIVSYTEYTNERYMTNTHFFKKSFIKNTEKGKITTHPVSQQVLKIKPQRCKT